jgi:hypothetical protein
MNLFSQKIDNNFEIDIIANSTRASMNEECLRVGYILGNMIQLSTAHKGIIIFLIGLFLDEDRRTSTITIHDI